MDKRRMDTQRLEPDWAARRGEYPITQRCVYLNTGWSGPSSTRVVETAQARLERESYDGPTTPDVRHEKALLVQSVRKRFASLIGAAEDDVALMYTTTEGVNTVLRGLGLGAGDHVITTNLEHNAVMVPSYMARLRDRVELSIVRTRAEDAYTNVIDAFERAFTPRTRLLVLSEISYNRGTRLPMREICAMAHARGALVCVDAAQSAGQIPIDVRDVGCDFMALPGHKWLLGPDGAAMLYAHPEHVERLQPLAVVHGANKHFDFEGHFEPALDTMRKFELTTHSGPVLAGLEVAIDSATALGLDVIEARCMELADRLIAALQAIDGVRITTPLDKRLRSGIVTFTVRDYAPESTADALWRTGRIVVRVCNGRRVRACCHVFNDERDIDATAEAVAQIAARGLPPGTRDPDAYRDLLLESDD